MQVEDKELLEQWKNKHLFYSNTSLIVSWIYVVFVVGVLISFLNLYFEVLGMHTIDFGIRLIASLHILIFFILVVIVALNKSFNFCFDETVIFLLKRKRGKKNVKG